MNVSHLALQSLVLSLLSFMGSTIALADSLSPNWSLEQVSSGWNEQSLIRSYFHNSELQRQWAWELMGKQKLQGNEKILDFGCGDGKISAELSRLVPEGCVTGIDISSEMFSFAQIKFPQYAYPNLQFTKSQSISFDDIPGKHTYDIVSAFCVFHLVSSPLTILKNLKEHLKPGGKLICVIPAGKNPAFFEAANQVFKKYGLQAPWNKPQNGPQTATMRTIEGCSLLLKESGFTPISLEMIDIDTPFYNKAELIAWMVGNTTANWNIPFSVSQAFFTDLVQLMCDLDPEILDREGRLHFKLSRIHLVATMYA